jgi:hypothetical protein
LVEILVELVYQKKKLPENFQYIAKKNVEKSGLLHNIFSLMTRVSLCRNEKKYMLK